MKRVFFSAVTTLICAAVMLCGCMQNTPAAPDGQISVSSATEAQDTSVKQSVSETTSVSEEQTTASETEASEDLAISETTVQSEEEITETEETAEQTTAQAAEDTIAETTAVPSETEVQTSAKSSVEKDGSYTTPEDVAEYIHTFGTLPSNFITKKEAQALGWDNKKGNLWDVTDGKSIGGDRFGNYEGLLPEKKGRKYTECDVNYDGGYRGAERIIFSSDGLIFYTNDHYESFIQLY